jgi:hypothetical protein
MTSYFSNHEPEPNYKDPNLLRRLRPGLIVPDLSTDEIDEVLMSKKRLKKYEKSALNSLPEGEPDTDETLRDLGFPDSTESRSCIRRKSR